MEDDIKNYRRAVREIKIKLNWSLKEKCPECKKMVVEDAFEVIKAYGGKKWICPNCLIEKGDPNAPPPVEKDGIVHCFSSRDHQMPEFRSLMKDHQKYFLEGFLKCEIYIITCEEGYPQDDYFFDDLSSAVLRLHTSLELFLPFKIKERLKSLNTNDTVISILLNSMKPNVREYLSMIKNLDINLKNKHSKGLFECQNIRNKIVHGGYDASLNDFVLVFKVVGTVIAELENCG